VVAHRPAEGHEPDAEVPIPRRLLAELLGTFALTFVAAGAAVVGAVSGGEVDHVARSVAPGLLVAAFIYAMGDVSGAHFNPAVTLAFVARRLFPAELAPLYWLVQIAGALAAALTLRVLFGTAAAHLGQTRPTHGDLVGLVVEAVLTWLLVTVVLGTADRYRSVGPNAALAVGATIALCGLAMGPITGASMNPARSIGPAVVNGDLGSLWIYLVGPLLGALVAAGTAILLHGERPPRGGKSVEAAEGKGASSEP
jgi:aquaporin Z